MALTSIGRTGPSGYVPLPNDLVLDDRTGQLPLAVEVLSLEGALPLGRFESPTGDAGLQLSLVSAFLGSRDPLRSVTSVGDLVVIEVPAWVSFTVPTDESQSPLLLVKPLRITHPLPGAERRSLPAERDSAHVAEAAVTPAEELRSISGLPPALLARLFGVSRTTYYKWMEGATPRDARFQHLVEMLAHLKEARRKLPGSIDVAAWLRTPVAPGGHSPLDYLHQRRFPTFRGLLLRAKSAEVAPSAPLPSTFATRPMSREELSVARERVSPSPRFEEEDSDQPFEGDKRR